MSDQYIEISHKILRTICIVFLALQALIFIPSILWGYDFRLGTSPALFTITVR